ncbi:NAD(P)H-dependent oxidoreductase [Gracilimonas sp.]|uniref:FMN-dependent NADH-azoreductase n=1 Tax=Gracilimonas sp. TaxID=1974203 RepID=UPI0032EBDA24
MINLLNVQVSPRRDKSLSRNLSETFISHLNDFDSDLEIVHRDLSKVPPQFVDLNWIASAFTDSSERSHEQRKILHKSDKYIDEIRWAEIIVIGTPMFNYGMPAALKAWIDQIARISETFSFDLNRGDFPIEPILKNKKLVVLTSSGEFGFDEGEIRETQNHLIPHLRTCSHYLGVDKKKDLYHIGIEFQEFKDDRHQKSIKNAHQKAQRLAEEISFCDKNLEKVS